MVAAIRQPLTVFTKHDQFFVGNDAIAFLVVNNDGERLLLPAIENVAAKEATQPVVAALPQTVKSDQTPARQALNHFQRAQDYLKQGNWSGYGDELKKVEALLKEMQKGQ